MPVVEQTGLIIPWRKKALSWGTMDHFRKRMLERIDYQIWACIRFFWKVLKDFSLGKKKNPFTVGAEKGFEKIQY